MRCPRANQQSVDLPASGFTVAANQSPLLFSRRRAHKTHLAAFLTASRRLNSKACLALSRQPETKRGELPVFPLGLAHPLFSACTTLLLPTFFLRQRRWLSRRHVATVRHLVHIFLLLR